MDFDPAARDELAASGTLRAAIALAPVPSPFFAVRDPGGEPRGVSVSLATALARELALPLALVIYENSGAITARADADEWDVTFMPADAERGKRVAFGPPYALVESTFLAAPGSGLRSYADVDRAGVRVAAIADTATARSAARVLHRAQLVFVASVEAAVAAIGTGNAEAVALSRDALARIAGRMPGARVLNGRFHAAGVAVAVPNGRPRALQLVSGFIERAKASNLVKRALDEAGIEHAQVAPPAA
jgi:polar amino acid transport system substrate-binding protein